MIVGVIDFKYISWDQFFIVYVNNVSTDVFEALTEGLKSYRPYSGYMDMTFSNPLKSYLSGILIRHFIKQKDNIIGPVEETGDDSEHNYPLAEFGFKWKGIEELYFSLFLSYKIERAIIGLEESDSKFSINAITDRVHDLKELELVIDEGKFQYLFNEKGTNLERAGMKDLTVGEIKQIIYQKLNSNYIYSMCYLEDHKVLKFNIMLEMQRTDSADPMKLILGLKYQPDRKQLRLITLF